MKDSAISGKGRKYFHIHNLPYRGVKDILLGQSGRTGSSIQKNLFNPRES